MLAMMQLSDACFCRTCQHKGGCKGEKLSLHCHFQEHVCFRPLPEAALVMDASVLQ